MLFVTTMMIPAYSKPVSKFMRAGIAIIITKSAQKESRDLDLLRDPSLPGKPQIASLVMFKRGLFIAIILGLSGTAQSQSQDTDIRPNADQLSAEEIKKPFSDVTMDGAYNFGRNGRAQSFYTEKHNPDGTLTYTEDGKSDPGRWFIRKDSLCFMYPSNQLAGGCFRVYQIKNCYYFYSAARRQVDYESGEAYWIARATKMGERAGCDPAFT